MNKRSGGPEPGELRGIALLATAVFAAAGVWNVSGAAHPSVMPHTANPIASHATFAHMSEVSNPVPPAPAGIPGHVFWLSRELAFGDPHLTDVVGAGDVMLGAKDYGLDPALASGADVTALVGEEIPAIFRRADVSFANLEGALYDGDDPPSKHCGHCYAFRSPTAYAPVLAQLGLRAMSLANNHSGDYGDPGRDSTIAALAANKIGAFGLDRDGARVAEIPLAQGGRAALVSFAPNTGTLDIGDQDSEARIVRGLKQNFAVVVVSFHGGGEGESYAHVTHEDEYFHGEDRGNVVAFAHTAIDAGADIVMGQGPHVPRALEIYKGHLIAYSLGNFWTYGAIDTSAIRGDGPVLEAWLQPDGTLAGFQIHSTEQHDGAPRLDPANEAERAMLALTKSDFPETAALLAKARAGAVTLRAGS